MSAALANAIAMFTELNDAFVTSGGTRRPEPKQRTVEGYEKASEAIRTSMARIRPGAKR